VPATRASVVSGRSGPRIQGRRCFAKPTARSDPSENRFTIDEQVYDSYNRVGLSKQANHLLCHNRPAVPNRSLTAMPDSDARPCSLPRRLAAIVYDGLILTGLWMIATAIVIIPVGDAVETGNPVFRFFLLLVAFAYLGGCWRYGRQTVGMRAWKIRLDAPDDPPSISRLALRFVVGIGSIVAAGAGFWTALWRDDAATWHDRASGTRLVVIPDQPRRSSP